MPAGKYSFYLHSDDRTDVAAAATLETVSQPLRGEFLRTAAIAGSVLYRIDCRLPGLLTELFDGQLRAGQFFSLLGAVSGRYLMASTVSSEGLTPLTGNVDDAGAERRRFTLQLLDDIASVDTAQLLESLPSRVRGTLLRNLLIAGFALHTLDSRFPRLLATLPVPPVNVDELQHLAAQVTGSQIVASTREPENSDGPKPVSVPEKEMPEASATAEIRNNMKKVF